MWQINILLIELHRSKILLTFAVEYKKIQKRYSVDLCYLQKLKGGDKDALRMYSVEGQGTV